MYLLMNKDERIARIKKDYAFGLATFVITEVFGQLPYGAEQITRWIEGRKASKHNRHLRQLMASCGCDKTEGYIRITHAATLNDTFWIKEESENVLWENVSLYRNKFNEIVSKLAFEGIGLYGQQFSLTSPEFSTSGSFRKCWKRENDGIYLYKRGTEKYANAGLEPYCESMASELAFALCKDAVRYECTFLHGELASKCKLFTSEKEGYIPFSVLARSGVASQNPGEYFERIGSGDLFRRMVVLDALTFNSDRHEGNYGVIVDNDTLQVLRMAPVFDMNLSMLPYATERDFLDIGAYLESVQPIIGDDFTATAQRVLTSEIRADLINLKEFKFSFRGNDQFSEKRVEALEKMLSRHIDAILGKTVCYTADIFPNKRKQAQERFRQRMQFLEEEPFVQSLDFVPSDENIDLALVIIEGEENVGLYYDDQLRLKEIEWHGGIRTDMKHLRESLSQQEFSAVHHILLLVEEERIKLQKKKEL